MLQYLLDQVRVFESWIVGFKFLALERNFVAVMSAVGATKILIRWLLGEFFPGSKEDVGLSWLLTTTCCRDPEWVEHCLHASRIPSWHGARQGLNLTLFHSLHNCYLSAWMEKLILLEWNNFAHSYFCIRNMEFKLQLKQEHCRFIYGR
jgi:hypothetical protein